MRYSKIVLALVTVVALIMAMSIMAQAASGPYHYWVYKTRPHYEYETVSIQDHEHYEDSASNLWYTIPGRVYYFDQSQFVSSHRSGLMNAYRSAGLNESYTITTHTSYKPIPADVPTNTYYALMTFEFTEGKWQVELDTTITYSGTFRRSPVGYKVTAELRNPPAA